MTYYIKNGNRYDVTNEKDITITNSLPIGTYVIAKDQFGVIFLSQIDNFTINHKIYGDTEKRSTRIMNTFNARPSGTGVLLTGEKGSGKTLLARMLSINCAAENIPTIVINESIAGDDFNKFIQTIDQPCMILFDEFEKVYSPNDQEQILTLLDGVFPSKKLFVMTCNEEYKLNSHMKNRPGRIFYSIDYEGLGEDFIREYCEDTLNNKQYIDNIVQMSMIYRSFNFDMLKALIEEMNRYDESPSEAIKMLNARPESDGRGNHYLIDCFVDEISVEIAEGVLYRNPLSSPIDVYEYHDDDSGKLLETFRPEDITSIDPRTKTFTFVKDNKKLVLTKPIDHHIENYMKYFD